jgi:hypothetical protein
MLPLTAALKEISPVRAPLRFCIWSDDVTLENVNPVERNGRVGSALEFALARSFQEPNHVSELLKVTRVFSP